jgi:hypothetical protein
MKRISVVLVGIVGLTAALLLTLLIPGRATGSPLLYQGQPAGDDKGESWREKAAVKMDDALLSQLQGDPAAPITVMVRLGGQADLSGAAELANRSERGAYVYHTLQAFANQRQASIRAFLDGEQRAGNVLSYRPFFIFNGLAVTGWPDTIWEIALRDDVQAVTAEQTYTGRIAYCVFCIPSSIRNTQYAIRFANARMEH